MVHLPRNSCHACTEGPDFESNNMDPGCPINDTMQGVFDTFGLPVTACLSVRTGNVDFEHCQPLAVIPWIPGSNR